MVTSCRSHFNDGNLPKRNFWAALIILSFYFLLSDTALSDFLQYNFVNYYPHTVLFLVVMFYPLTNCSAQLVTLTSLLSSTELVVSAVTGIGTASIILSFFALRSVSFLTFSINVLSPSNVRMQGSLALLEEDLVSIVSYP